MKSLKDHLVRTKLPNVEITAQSESCEKENCQTCNFTCDTDAFSTKAFGETFQIQRGVFNYNSQKVVYLLRCRIRGEAPYVGNAKSKFRARFDNYKSVHRSYRKKNVKYHSIVFINIMANTVIMGLTMGSSH